MAANEIGLTHTHAVCVNRCTLVNINLLSWSRSVNQIKEENSQLQCVCLSSAAAAPSAHCWLGACGGGGAGKLVVHTAWLKKLINNLGHCSLCVGWCAADSAMNYLPPQTHTRIISITDPTVNTLTCLLSAFIQQICLLPTRMVLFNGGLNFRSAGSLLWESRIWFVMNAKHTAEKLWGYFSRWL